MEQLRETVERALAPFFANVEASSEVAEVEPAVVSRPRAAPVAPRSPSPEPRRSDVATPITIAYEPDVAVSREPEVVAREPMIPRDAPDEARELGAMAAAPVRATPRESRSLKSVAAQTVAIPPGSIPRAARPPEAAPRRDVRVVTPVAARRKLAVATGITVAVLAAASAALYFLGYADRAIGVLTSVVR